MDDTLSAIKEPLKKALDYIAQNRGTLSEYSEYTRKLDKDKITIEDLADVACNHLFDDFPEIFGISKLEGHAIRAYFHNPTYNFVLELHNEFPDYFQKERPIFLARVNESRVRDGYTPITM